MLGFDAVGAIVSTAVTEATHVAVFPFPSVTVNVTGVPGPGATYV